MIYKAEVFDKFQYLYEVTKFNDHQLHCVMSFEDKLNSDIMEKAIMLLLKVVPILSCVYRHDNGNSYWESVNPSEFEDVFAITENEIDFNSFTTSKTNELTGPQIKACLFQSKKDSLSIILNHMVCDAAGFKQCLYLLSSLYSKLMENPCYSPEYTINGDRSFQTVNSEIPFVDKAKALLFQNKDSNQSSKHKFPMSIEKNITPFILTHQISSSRYASICEYCKNLNVTINDVVLAAYYRVLSKMFNMDGKALSIPIMVDMRRYLKDRSFKSLSNMSSTVITNIIINPAETFDETVSKVNKEMNIKKSKNIGLNGFVKLSLVSKIFSDKVSYKIIKKSLENPYICTTNIGVIDYKKLVFEGSSVQNAFMCGSIKYRPHFQLALSSFADKITFSSNLYGSQQDKDTITDFMSRFDKELPK